jgi:acyl carrier protein
MHFQLPEIERRVCEVASKHLCISRDQVLPSSRLIEDLHCDSLDLVELIMELEREFSLVMPNDAPNPVYKSIFTRSPFRMRDLAELVYLQQGTGTPERQGWRRRVVSPVGHTSIPFSQLSGRWEPNNERRIPLFERLQIDGQAKQFRRRSDGMRCIMLSSAEVEIGCNSEHSLPDEHPVHVVELDSFVIDAEPVSTIAYCRFLNSIKDASTEDLADWFVLDATDDRREQLQLQNGDDGWEPIRGTEHMPMVLVSWYGARAYSLWANGQDWTSYRSDDSPSFLPSEAQWEYAARGANFQQYPWGNECELNAPMAGAQHEQGTTYTATTMRLSAVNEELGMSPFGLHHMAGNVWQWCQDWYDDAFYGKPEARGRNPVNRQNTGVRSERGGSWVGPIELCRSSYRRGRAPSARGRCLGFRCISDIATVASLK